MARNEPPDAKEVQQCIFSTFDLQLLTVLTDNPPRPPGMLYKHIVQKRKRQNRGVVVELERHKRPGRGLRTKEGLCLHRDSSAAIQSLLLLGGRAINLENGAPKAGQLLRLR